MTPTWHDGPLDGLDWDGASPVAWSVADGDVAGRRHALARALVAKLAGVGDGAVLLARSAAGAPRVAAPAGWYLGLSRRGERCLIGAATRPIAVDRETADDAAPLWDMLTAAETRDLRSLPQGERPRAWLRRWTIKEAHAKLVGEPRRLAPEGIETQVIDPACATARCKGVSQCWTRETDGAIETVALWADVA